MDAYKDIVTRTVDRWQEHCGIQEAVYWDLWSEMRKLGNIRQVSSTLDVVASQVPVRLFVTLEDGFEIMLVFMKLNYTTWHFNGYVTIPKSYPFLFEQAEEAKGDYDLLQSLWAIGHVELTYMSQTTIGWDHAHCVDVDFRHTMLHQGNDKMIAGPVQVFQEALDLIENLRQREIRFQQQKKKEWVSQWEEEFMQKAWSPHRVAQWVFAGMDL